MHFRFGPVFALGHRVGLIKILLPLVRSEAVNDPRFRAVVRGHLHLYPIADGQANKAFAHFPGNVRENQMIVGECDPKHRSWKHVHDRPFDLDRFLRIHQVGAFG